SCGGGSRNICGRTSTTSTSSSCPVCSACGTRSGTSIRDRTCCAPTSAPSPSVNKPAVLRNGKPTPSERRGRSDGARMRITNVEASVHDIPVSYPLIERPGTQSVTFVRVETNEGIVGHSLVRGRHAVAVYQFIQNRYGPVIIGEDPRNTERVWHKLFWDFNQRV